MAEYIDKSRFVPFEKTDLLNKSEGEYYWHLCHNTSEFVVLATREPVPGHTFMCVAEKLQSNVELTKVLFGGDVIGYISKKPWLKDQMYQGHYCPGVTDSDNGYTFGLRTDKFDTEERAKSSVIVMHAEKGTEYFNKYVEQHGWVFAGGKLHATNEQSKKEEEQKQETPKPSPAQQQQLSLPKLPIPPSTKPEKEEKGMVSKDVSVHSMLDEDFIPFDICLSLTRAGFTSQYAWYTPQTGGTRPVVYSMVNSGETSSLENVAYAWKKDSEVGIACEKIKNLPDSIGKKTTKSISREDFITFNGSCLLFELTNKDSDYVFISRKGENDFGSWSITEAGKFDKDDMIVRGRAYLKEGMDDDIVNFLDSSGSENVVPFVIFASEHDDTGPDQSVKEEKEEEEQDEPYSKDKMIMSILSDVNTIEERIDICMKVLKSLVEGAIGKNLVEKNKTKSESENNVVSKTGQIRLL